MACIGQDGQHLQSGEWRWCLYISEEDERQYDKWQEEREEERVIKNTKVLGGSITVFIYLDMIILNVKKNS